jgi:ABC-type antimicrobial peptide transport system permease subunit
MAYGVGQRVHEIGVRMALGARPTGILSLLMRQGMVPVGLGVVIGAAGAVALTRMLRRILFQVNPSDPATFALAAALLVMVAAAAIYLPARRATRVAPVEALRYE